MRKRKNFRKKRPKDTAVGLSVTVFNNNVEGALKVLKKKVKNSNLFLDLRKKEYYVKPSEINRQKRNMAKLRNKYKNEKEQKNY
ncbi:MAG: 30S ribosomal protein S21 [Candidatus Pelagibacter sp. TMED64]|nr:30S ribosomal protein S21 [Candidatus Pelagibacter sp.]OUU66482.1 MAG: 30S ribosomal protein S21 [Candidatus Pelagibacter sp. TMED64]|tara:strand:+ start:6036 stop:6287 length:252 start_codon:yes stop_codon:yes gene_type:complete